MAAADRPINKWRKLAQAAEPKDTIDARLRCAIPPSEVEVEKRRHELHDDLFAGRRWRVHWRDSEGLWHVDGIPPRWWRNYEDINWFWSTLARDGGLLQVEIYDADDDLAVSEPSPPANQTAAVISEPEVGQRTARPEREKGRTGPKPKITPMVIAAMRDMDATRLAGMKLSEMAITFKASEDTCTKARNTVLDIPR